FQTVFNLHSAASRPSAFGDLQVRSEAADYEVAKFDLSLDLTETSDSFRGEISYDVALFDRDTVERFASHFATLLRAATEDPSARVAALPLMSDAERRRVVVEWNETRRPYPRDRRIDELFQEQAAETPDKVALVFESRTMTYRELDEASS